MPVCNICGGQNFGKGPGNRLSVTSKLPKCLTCFSLERHRSLRRVYMQLLDSLPFQSMSALLISEDKAIYPKWFASLEVSVYDVSNSIDIQNIDRPDKSYDIVICNHVLEHVENDVKALQELMRIVADRGFLQLSVPDPIRRNQTTDWGYPNWSQHGHYRLYGKDIEEKFQRAFSPNIFKIKVFSSDPVTGMDDVCFFFTSSELVASLIQKQMIKNIFIPSVIDFQKGGNAKIYQTHGWYQPETSGTWSIGGDGVLAISLADISDREKLEKGLNLSVTGLAFLTEKQPQASIQLICNQNIITEWDFSFGDSLKTFSTFIPPKVILNEAVLEIIFRSRNSKSPKDLRISPDSRILGLFVREIKIL